MPRRYTRQCRQAGRFDGGFSRRRRVSEHVHAFHVGRRGFPYRNSFFRRSNRCRVATPGNAGKQRGMMGVSCVGVACRGFYDRWSRAAAFDVPCRRWGVLEVPCRNRLDCSSETFRNPRVLHVGRRRSPRRNSCFRRSNRCRVATPGNAGKQGGVMGVSHVGVACRSTCLQIPPSLFPTKQ